MPNFAGDFDILQIPDVVSAIDPGPGATSPGSGDTLAVPDFASDIDPGPGEPLLELGDSLDMPHFASNYKLLQVQDFVGAIDDPRPGTTSPASGDILAMPDFVSDIDPGPGEPLLESGRGLDMPHFASDCDMLQVQEFVYAINPGHWESGDILAVPDIVSNLFGSGGQIPSDRDSDSCHSVMCTSPPDPGGDEVSSLSVCPVLRDRITMMTCLTSDLSGSRKFVPQFCDTSCIVCLGGSHGSIFRVDSDAVVHASVEREAGNEDIPDPDPPDPEFGSC